VPGRGLVSGSAAGAVLWDLDPPWVLERVVGAIDSPAPFMDRVQALDWSPDGKLLAAGGGEPSRGGELKVIRAQDGGIAREFPDPHTDAVLGVEFSPDGRFIATASADKFVKVFDLESGKLVKAFEGHTNQVLGVSWRSDGRLLASGGADNAVKVWDFESGEQRRTIGGFGKQVAGIEFLAWNSSVASASADGTVRIHNAESGAGEKSLGAGGYLHALALTPGGRLIAAGGHEGKLFIWDGKEGKLLHTLEPPGAGK
jgi:WD40 repeat protein